MTPVCKAWGSSLGSAFFFYNEVLPDMQTVGKLETYHHEVCQGGSLQSKGYPTIQRL